MNSAPWGWNRPPCSPPCAALAAYWGPLRPPSSGVKLARMTKELCTGVRNNEYLVVLKTPPGAAQYYGSAIDKAGLDIVLGTIAGDDTIALICAIGVDAGELADAFSQMAVTGVPAEILSRSVREEFA